MKRLIPFLIGLIILPSINAQTSFGPEAFNYQAILRDENGEIVSNEFVSVRFTLSSSPAGGEPLTVSYVETHDAFTNEMGLINVSIGKGQASVGDITTLQFGQPEYYLQTEIYRNNVWTNVGSQQLVSVPFAERADIAESLTYDIWGQNGNDDVNDLYDFIGTTNAEAMVFKTNDVERLRIHQTNGNVGIGTDNPGNPADGLGFVGKVLHVESPPAEPAVILMSGTENTASGTNVTQITHSVGEFYIRNHNPNGSLSMSCGTGEDPSLLVTNGGIEVRNGNSDNAVLKVNSPLGNRSRLFLHHESTGTNVSSDGGILDMLGSNLTLVNYESGLLQLGTSGAITMSIANDEQVGIGTSAPQSELHIEGGTDASLTTDAGGYLILGPTGSTNLILDNNEIMARNGGFSTPLYINGNGGNVAINQTGVPSWALTVNGSAAKPGGGSWTATSDERLKYNVQNYQRGLNEILSIRPVSYQYIENSGYDSSVKHVGVIAQEINQIAPEMVQTVHLEMKDGNTGEYLCVDPSDLTYMLVNAVKELKETIVKMQLEIDDLKKNR
jgi:hypothetical protein